METFQYRTKDIYSKNQEKNVKKAVFFQNERKTHHFLYEITFSTVSIVS